MKILKKSLSVILSLVMIIMMIGCSAKSSNELGTKNKYWHASRLVDDNDNFTGKFVFQAQVDGVFSNIVETNAKCYFDIYYNQNGWFTIFTHPYSKDMKDTAFQFPNKVWKVTFDYGDYKYDYYTSFTTDKKEGIGFYTEYGQVDDYNAIIDSMLTFEKVKITIVDIQDAQNEYKTNTIDLIELRNLVEGSKEIK